MTEIEKAAREIAENIRLSMICGACGAALPNEECGHKKNGVPNCCPPSIDTSEAETAIATLIERERMARDELWFEELSGIWGQELVQQTIARVRSRKGNLP